MSDPHGPLAFKNHVAAGREQGDGRRIQGGLAPAGQLLTQDVEILAGVELAASADAQITAGLQMDQGGDLVGRRSQGYGCWGAELGQAVRLQVEAAVAELDASLRSGALQPDQALGGLDRAVGEIHRAADHLHDTALQGAVRESDASLPFIGGGEGAQGHQAPLARAARADLQVAEIEALGLEAHLLTGLEGTACARHRLQGG